MAIRMEERSRCVDVVIVGASLAGLRAAQAARAGGFDGELVVVGEEAHRPYTRPPLSKEVLAGEHDGRTRRAPLGQLDAQWRLGRAGDEPRSRRAGASCSPTARRLRTTG